jgi:Protein of unknown function (DUF3034)
MKFPRRIMGVAIVTGLLLSSPGYAQGFFVGDQGKLLLTSGFSDLEGSGGGGLVPLAFITGYGTRDSWGANAHFTDIELRDYRLYTFGGAAGLFDRVELSYTRQHLDITGTALDHLAVDEDVIGAKVKILGDAVYGQDSWLPQLAVGAQYKHNDGISNAAAAGLPGLKSPTQLGATSEHSVDYYVAASKVILGESLVINAVLRATKANQFGFLGFGGDRKSGYSVKPEGTVAYLLTRKFALGAEIRSAPHNLSVDNESAAWDVFAAWAPIKNFSVVAAYLNLGSILAPVTGVTRRQSGLYLSLQAGF